MGRSSAGRVVAFDSDGSERQHPTGNRSGCTAGAGKGDQYAVQSVLEKAGVKVDAATVKGKGHSFEPDWTELETWLRKTLGDRYPGAARAMSNGVDRTNATTRATKTH